MSRPKLPDSFTSLFDGPPGETLEAALLRHLNIKTQAGQTALRLALENVMLFDKKQQDYGSANIRGFGDFGVVVRINDKFERIKNLYMKRRKRPQNESILDSFDDISNYCLIARMLLTNQWPNE